MCAASIAEINHDIATSKNSVNEYFIAVEQMEKVSEAAKRILAGHSISAMRHTSRWDAKLEKSLPAYERIKFCMDQVTVLFIERVTNEMLMGLTNPLIILQMQKLVRECAEEVAFDALNFDSSPFIDVESLRAAAE
jgi:hypothetical protein